MVWRVIARREDTTTTGCLSAVTRAASASSRRFTASSNAGGRSRKDTPISANTWVAGRPASQTRSSSAKRSGLETRRSTVRPRSLIALTSEPATMGHAGRGSRATCSSVEPRRAQPSSRGLAPRVASQSLVTGSPQFLAAQRTGSVVAVHCAFDAGFESELERVGDAADHLRQALLLRLGEAPEHVPDARAGALAAGLADPYSEAHEVVATERLDDGAHAVVSRRGTGPLDAHPAQGQVELVVDDPRVRGRDARVLERLRDGLTRQVHVGLRQDEPHAAGLRSPDQRLPSFLLDRRLQPARQLAHACEAEVVARFRVLRLGIAEPDDQSLLFFPVFHARTARPAASAADLSEEYR